MLELRWVTKKRMHKVPANAYGGGSHEVTEFYKILQYRRKDKHVDSSTTTPVPDGWSDWQDVPDVGLLEV